MQIDRKWEIPRKHLTLEKTIGEGEFGKVMSAKMVDTTQPLGKIFFINTNFFDFTTIFISQLSRIQTGSSENVESEPQ